MILRVLRGASLRVIDGLNKANRIAYVFRLTSIPREMTAGVNLSTSDYLSGTQHERNSRTPLPEAE